MRQGKGVRDTRWRSGLLLLLVLVMVASPALAEVKKLPEFSGDTVLGHARIDNQALLGRVVLVNFWATWCPPCRKEIPSLMEMNEKYKDRGFTVLGVSMDEGGRSVVEKFLEKLHVSYPVIIGSTGLAREFGGVMGVPASFLVDRQGIMVKRYDGYTSEAVLSGEIEKLLAK